MNVFISILNGILEQGFIYAILAMGIYITYEILDYPDLSVDGTFPLGAAVTAMLILKGVNPWLAILASFITGAVAGMFTGIFHVKFKIKDLLSGIITMTGLYSINLMIAGGKAILPITNQKTIFNSGIVLWIPESLSKYKTLIIIFLCTMIIKFVLDWYLKTKSGLLLRATGDNAVMVTLIAKNHGKVKIIGLMICNGLAATAGSILSQQTRNFDVTSGTGMMVMGLASVIIGISMFGKIKIIRTTSMVVLGSILYKACLSIALNLNFNPNNLKLLMALIFLVALIGKDMLDKGGKKQNAKIKKH
jgi:putative tryptophan/tyrosine transport system permease protein